MAEFTIKDYLRLIKSGIIAGNSLHYIVGVLIAAPLALSDAGRIVFGLIATMLLIASACMINNWLDRQYDKKMKRAAVRLTAQGRVTRRQVYSLAIVMAVLGLILLWWLVNPLTAVLGAVAWFSYSYIYTLSKRFTAWSTIIGLLPGSLPAVAGYTSVTGQLDTTAGWLFLLIAAWQLPHFYAIAIYRRKEYLAAGLPMLSTIVSAKTMYQVMIVSIVFYLAVAAAMTYLVLNYMAGLILVGVALLWLIVAFRRGSMKHEAWARKMFGWSMYVSLSLVLMATIQFVLVQYM